LAPIHVIRVLLDRLKQSFRLFPGHVARRRLGLPILRLVFFVGFRRGSLVLVLVALFLLLITLILLLVVPPLRVRVTLLIL
jgi:hypothetical protein